MVRFLAHMHGLVRDDKGATAIEYGLIATLVSVIIIGGLTLLGGNLDIAFDTLGAALDSTP
jgi:pilus assembly protein Flp/PilA